MSASIVSHHHSSELAKRLALVRTNRPTICHLVDVMDRVSVKDHCGFGKVHAGKPTGREDTIGGVHTYIAEPQGGSRAKSIIFITDIFGWELTNVRLLADEYAAAGFYSYIPDLHEGDSLPVSFLDNVEPNLKTQATLSVVDKAKNAAIVPATLGPWLIKHREGVVKPLLDGFINTVRMTPGTEKVGAIGFCVGGRYAILEAHGPAEGEGGAKTGGVDAAVACHPSLISIPADFDAVTKPLSLALGDKDSDLDLKSVRQIQDALGKKKDEVPHEIRIYEDQIHGFTLRGDFSSEKDKKSMDEATAQGVEWFKKYLS